MEQNNRITIGFAALQKQAQTGHEFISVTGFTTVNLEGNKVSRRVELTVSPETNAEAYAALKAMAELYKLAKDLKDPTVKPRGNDLYTEDGWVIDEKPTMYDDEETGVRKEGSYRCRALNRRFEIVDSLPAEVKISDSVAKRLAELRAKAGIK